MLTQSIFQQFLDRVFPRCSRAARRSAARRRPAATALVERLEERTLLSAFPFVQSINRLTPVSGSTSLDSVTYQVTFNMAVSGVDASDFQVVTTGNAAVSAPVQVTTVNASTYTVLVSGISGNGTIGLNLVDNNSIHDVLNGNPLTTSNAPASFLPRQTIGVTPSPNAVATGDFDKNGTMDIAVAAGTGGASTVIVRLGNGDGTFGGAQSLSVGNLPVGILAIDVNNDTNLDLVTVNQNGNNISVLLGAGNGTFGTQRTFAAGATPSSIATADFDANGIPDIVVTNNAGASGQTVNVLLGATGGNYAAPQTFVTGAPGGNPFSVAVGDVNGDMVPDLAVTLLGNAQASVLFGDPNNPGRFLAPQTYAVGQQPDSVALSDVNGDGLLDMVVANYNTAGAGSVSVRLADSSNPGQFLVQRTYATGVHPLAVTVADVNGDNFKDLIVTNQGTSTSVLLGNGDGTFKTQQTFDAGGALRMTSIADLNGDLRPDLVVATSTGVSVLLNADKGNFRGQTYSIVQVAPSVAITRNTAATTSASSVSFTVTFSEVVTGLDASDFQVVTTGSVSVGTPIVISGSGAVYTVTINNVKGNGTLGLNLLDDNTIRDLSKNPLAHTNGQVTYQAQPGVSVTGASLSMAVADFNGDTLLDLALPNFDPLMLVIPNFFAVALGNGNGTFQAARTFPVDFMPRAMATGDVNGDGRQDLLVGSAMSNSLTVNLANGGPTLFTQLSTVPLSTTPNTMKLADVNGDNKLDLVTGGASSISVMLGNGDGTFVPAVTYPAGTVIRGMALLDINDDGVLDAVVSNSTSNTVSILLGDRTNPGAFLARTTVATGVDPRAVTLGDINGDGKADLIVGNYVDNTISVMIGNGDGTFLPQMTTASGTQPSALTIADVNSDGRPDLAVTSYNTGVLRVMLGNGSGTFQAPVTFSIGSAGSKPISVVEADINGDGRPDLVTGVYNGQETVLLNTGRGDLTGPAYTVSQVAPFVQSINRTTPAGSTAMTPSVTYTVKFSETVTGVDAADFQVVTTGSVTAALPVVVTQINGTDYSVTINGLSGNGTVGLNLVDNNTIRDLSANALVTPGATATFQTQQTVAVGTPPNAVSVGDLNRDGVSDLVVVGTGSPTVRVLLSNGNGTFQASQTFTTGAGPRSVTTADVNRDGNVDLVVGNDTDGTVSVFLGNGNGTFNAQQTVAVGATPRSVQAVDVSGDGLADLVVANYSASTVSVLLGNGDGTFKARTTATTGTNPTSVAITDVSSDGRPDLLVANLTTSNVSVLLGTGGGAFGAQQTFAAGSIPTSVAAGDLNGDNLPDLAISNGGAGTVSVLLGNANGTFQARQTLAVGTGPISLSMADVSGDAVLDLVTANSTANSVSVLLGNGNGTFKTQQSFATGTTPVSVGVIDVNGDGRYEIVAANQGGSTLSILPNAATGSFVGQVYTVLHVAPVITTNTLSITEGATVVLTTANLNSFDPDSGPAELTYRVTALTGGRFELTTAPGVAITSFTQAALNAGQVQFVQDGSEPAPSYTLIVRDDSQDSPPSTVTIGTYTNVNDRPVITTNTLSLTEGTAVVLGVANLNTTDPDNTPAQLTYTATTVAGGRLEYVANPGVAITNFTQADINTGLVRFVQDGSETPPSYTLTVSDGALTSVPSTVVIGVFTNVNDAPVIAVNTLSINQGQALVLGTAQLNATDPENSPPQLKYTVNSVAAGRFELVSSPGVAITTFTQADVNTGKVQFVQNGSTTPPSYTLTVNDGLANSAPSTVTVGTFTKLSDPPQIVTNTLSINEGQTVVLGSSNLNATDLDHTPSQLTYNVLSITGGRFESITRPGVAITSFTQAAINGGQVQFVQDGSETPPTYTVAVSDGTQSSPPSTVTIGAFATVNDTPMIAVNNIQVDPGQTVVLTSANLNTVDADSTPAQQVYTVQNVANGQFESTTNPGVAITTFTQADVNAGLVQFVRSSAPAAPSYRLIVTDGAVTSPPSTVVIGAPVGAAPVITTNTLTITQAGAVILTNANLNSTDPDTSAAQLTYVVSSISNGRFELTTNPGAAITTFTQADVNAGRVRFVHDGSQTAPSYTLTVNDGATTSAPSTVVTSFTLLQGTSLVNGTLYVVGGSGKDSVKIKVKKGNLIVDSSNAPDFVVKPGQVNQIVLFLGNGDDTVKIDDSVTASVIINGGSGDDKVTAGGGSVVFVGGGGDDKLKGGDRNDILIGGSGNDTLTGGKGSDLLISGSTSYDNDSAALAALAMEWNSGASFQTRVDHLLHGTGPTGIQLQPGVTVFGDTDEDKLDGADGQDWLLSDNEDKIKHSSLDDFFTNIDPTLGLI